MLVVFRQSPRTGRWEPWLTTPCLRTVIRVVTKEDEETHRVWHLGCTWEEVGRLFADCAVGLPEDELYELLRPLGAVPS